MLEHHRNFQFSAAGIFRPVDWMCTPGMGVNLWGASPLYGNPITILSDSEPKVLADGKGVSVRRGLEEARAQSYEPTNRNSI
jgi:hypothetical protein